MKIKYRLKVYPITEDGEVIYEGCWINVTAIDFEEGWIEGEAHFLEFGDPSHTVIYGMFFGKQRGKWFYKDNRDKRDKISELYVSVNDGEYVRVDIENN